MKYFALVPMLALIACGETAMDAEMTDMAPKQITSEADFVAKVADKKMVLEGTDNFVMINSNGTIGGNFGGSALAGTWEWRDGAWCRVLTAGPRGPSPEDCQIWADQGGGAYTVTRNRGEGSSFVYVDS